MMLVIGSVSNESNSFLHGNTSSPTRSLKSLDSPRLSDIIPFSTKETVMDNPYELYSSYPKLQEATKELDEAIKAAQHTVLDGTDPYVAYKGVTKVLEKHLKGGACDSEPCWHAAKKFATGVGLDPDEFYAC
jgi:hypothetical protein